MSDDQDREARLEVIISYVLIVGVVSAVVLESIGIALYYGAFGNLQYTQTPNVYVHGENFFAFIADKVQNLFVAENAIAFMTLGIVVLILTPFIRAITSCIYFGWERNWKYVAITLFVLVILTISLAVH
jgi:uncharacterized membrane protein